MNNKTSRLKKLEKRATPDGGRVYAIKDIEGLYWVDGKAYTEKEFLALGASEVIIKPVGFDLSKV